MIKVGVGGLYTSQQMVRWWNGVSQTSLTVFKPFLGQTKGFQSHAPF